MLWYGDFNEYIRIDGRLYIDRSHTASVQIATSFVTGLIAATLFEVALLAVRPLIGNHGLVIFALLGVAYFTLLFAFGEFGMYVDGVGPDGRTWVKGRFDDSMRFSICIVASTLLTLISIPILCLVTGSRKIEDPNLSS